MKKIIFIWCGATTIVAAHFINRLILILTLIVMVGFSSFCVSMESSSFCFDEAGQYYDINPELLKAIAYTESRLNPLAVNHSNRNGTSDYGLMQINTIWFDKLEDLGVSKESVINNSCTNIFVGAWILAQNFQSHGEGWLAVGAYNAGFSKSRKTARETYISLVKSNFEAIRSNKL